jgi:cytochrome P450
MRRIVSRGFTPPRIKEMATAIEEIAERCLAGMILCRGKRWTTSLFRRAQP